MRRFAIVSSIEATPLFPIVAVVKHDHIASQRVLEKAGLRPSGTREAYGEALLLYEAQRELRDTGA